MKVAIVGSRSLHVENLKHFLPWKTTEIISGGAKGIDAQAREYALAHGIKYTEYLPEYDKYKRAAPLKRNITIIEQADLVVAIWDGVSRGTSFVIKECRRRGKKIRVFVLTTETPEEQAERMKTEPPPWNSELFWRQWEADKRIPPWVPRHYLRKSFFDESSDYIFNRLFPKRKLRDWDYEKYDADIMEVATITEAVIARRKRHFGGETAEQFDERLTYFRDRGKEETVDQCIERWFAHMDEQDEEKPE